MWLSLKLNYGTCWEVTYLVLSNISVHFRRGVSREGGGEGERQGEKDRGADLELTS